jgi:hypothetical protein
MDRLKMLIVAWYEGQFVPYKNDPNDLIIALGGKYERHWTARLARVSLTFMRTEWKWVIGVMLSLIGLYIAWRKL